MRVDNVMDKNTYIPVAVNEAGGPISTKESWIPFFRQFFVCTGVWVSYFVYGLAIGAPTVFVPQMRREANSTDVITDEMVSWLTSMIGFSALPCVLILTVMMKLLGRKISFLISSMDVFITFLIFYYSTSYAHLLTGAILQGLFNAAQILVNVIVLTEYTSPKYRGVFLTLKSASNFWGIWIANAIGTFFHWKTIGLVGLVCSVYVLVSALFWPESPYWLASKERYEECAASHRWLKGCDEDAEKELQALIASQKEYVRSSAKAKTTLLENIKQVATQIISVGFYKPILIAIMTGTLSIMSGKLVYTVYAIDIIKKITKDESTAYTGMLILDGITIIGMYIGCTLTKFLKRRVLLLGSSSVGAGFLFVLSLYLYLIKLAVFNENKVVSICLLICFSLAIGCGPLVMSTNVFAELIPIRSRNLAICVIALCAKFTIGTVLKIGPYIFKGLGVHGAFLFFGIASTIFICLLYIYLPETKDKTLQEIADSMNGNEKRKKCDESVALAGDINNKNG